MNDRGLSQRLATLLYKDTTEKEIGQAFGEWIDTMAPWEWYATMTFRDPVPQYETYTEQSGLLYTGRSYQMEKYPNWTKTGWKSAHKALESFNNALVMEMEYQNPVSVAVMELQERGVPHWHMLVANVGSQRRMTWVDWLYEHYGIGRILPYQAELGARYYLGKYLSKEQADIRFSPALTAKLSRRGT